MNQLLAMHVRTGAGPVQATQRIVDRGAGVVVEELRTRARVDAQRRRPSPTRSDAPPRSHPSPPRHARTSCSQPGPSAASTSPTACARLSEDLRDARREEIRKTATKRRAAMLVPTIAVLAPVMLLFIAAPLPVDRVREPVMRAARRGPRPRSWHGPDHDSEEQPCT